MLFLENAKSSFSKANRIYGRNDLEVEFYHRFANMIPDKVDVDTLVLAFKIALEDAEYYKENTTPFIALIPQYIRQISSVEFAHEFRKKFNKEVLGLTQEELPDVDYGYVEVEDDVIDISMKDRGEVLAALYNASTPIGKGFMQYNPMSWTKEIANIYFEQYGKKDATGAVTFKWILGRPVSCTFINDLVYVKRYNNDNEYKLAQRAISTCPNIKKDKIKNK